MEKESAKEKKKKISDTVFNFLLQCSVLLNSFINKVDYVIVIKCETITDAKIKYKNYNLFQRMIKNVLS